MKENQLTKVEEAVQIILNATEDFGIEMISVEDCVGHVLKENIRADRDMPPFDRVSMDGVAIRSEAFRRGRKEFKIEGIQAAGSPREILASEEGCIESMTGAVLPESTDAVVPYEQVDIKEGMARILVDEVRSMQNVHRKGLDRKKDEILICEDQIISPAEIGVLATTGAAQVRVGRLPKTAIISTGDELVPIGAKPLPHQIRMSNIHSLKALVQPLGIRPDLFHLQDDPVELKAKISDLLEQYDVLMFSGAVSKGKYDFLPEILDELEVRKLFHRVQQRPGKPFWFGKKQAKTVFAFPGNPVSTYVSCMKYFIPWLRKSLGVPPFTDKFAVLDQDFEFRPELTYFLQVKLINRAGTLYAVPEAGNGSGDLANLTLNDAFLELPADRSTFNKGDIFPYLEYRI